MPDSPLDPLLPGYWAAHSSLNEQATINMQDEIDLLRSTNALLSDANGALRRLAEHHKQQIADLEIELRNEVAARRNLQGYIHQLKDEIVQMHAAALDIPADEIQESVHVEDL